MYSRNVEPYKCKFFNIRELLPGAFFSINEHYGDLLWGIFDDRALRTLDLLRETYGPVTINNWAQGGTFDESGYRVPGTVTGAHLSQHKFGRAFDCKFKDIAAEKIRADLYAQGLTGPFQFITCIEDFPGMTWFHFDTRNHDGLLVVSG